jgi:hypothetical protein
VLLKTLAMYQRSTASTAAATLFQQLFVNSAREPTSSQQIVATSQRAVALAAASIRKQQYGNVCMSNAQAVECCMPALQLTVVQPRMAL